MGIRYLNKLVKSQDVYQDELFGSGPLVIDGSGLVYQLYFTSGLEQNRGGEYGAFEDLLSKFFGVLQDCHISPYVIFDGCMDFLEKWEMQRKRAGDKVKRAHKAAERGRTMGVLPTLIWEVFRQTLDSLGVPLARTYTEADRQAAALAHEWICPVLSSDTDFFIFPINGGMLPSEHFRWQNVLQCGERRYIPCKRYFSSRFCEVNQIQPQFLPVFAVLAGNDYVKKSLWTGDMSSLLQWIRSLDVGDPLELLKAALTEKNKPQTEEKLRSLQEAAAHYVLPPSPLSAFFCEGTTPPLPPKMVDVVPDWMRIPVTTAQFSSDFLDVVTSRRVGLSVVVDHKDTPSANLVSLPLRRVLYGLLLGSDSGLTVEERDRDGLEVRYTQVQPDANVPFNIKTLEQETEEQRRQVLLDALGLNHQFDSSLPSHLSHLALPLAATCYWLMKATPPPPLSLLKALLIGWCKGDELRPKAARTSALGRCLELDWCHWLNEWQSCFRDSFLLNQLLREPLPQPTIAQLYNGKLLHVLLHRMKIGRLEHFVPPGTCSEEDYCALLAIAQIHTGRSLQEPAAPGGFYPNQPQAPPQPWGPLAPPLNISQPWGPLAPPPNISQPWGPLAPPPNISQPWGPLAPPPNISQPWGPLAPPPKMSQPWGPFVLPLKTSQPWEPLASPQNSAQLWEPLALQQKSSQPWEPFAPPPKSSQPWEPFALPQKSSQPWESFAPPLKISQPWVPFTPPPKSSQPWEPLAPPQKSSQPWEPLSLPLKRSPPWEPFAPQKKSKLTDVR